MNKVNVRTSNPARYARIAAEQEELKRTYSSSITMARLCPFCSHKIEVLCRGSHGGTYTQCPKCSENVFFPPVLFRRVR